MGRVSRVRVCILNIMRTAEYCALAASSKFCRLAGREYETSVTVSTTVSGWAVLQPIKDRTITAVAISIIFLKQIFVFTSILLTSK
jgi:hypothetical protein